MKAVSEALELILSNAPLMPAVATSLEDAIGRVLRVDAVADMDSPPFDCSSMDGYALRAEDSGRLLTIAAEIQAGQTGEVAIAQGECARIFTGARIPGGADCVLMQEEAVIEEGKLRPPKTEAGDNIRKRGENCRCGDLVVGAGTVLRPVDLAALASCGVTRPLVSGRPRAVHFATGDELVDPSQTPAPGRIRDSNSVLIAALLASSGARLVHQARMPDSFEASARLLNNAPEFDVLLLSGGASVGDYDFARPLLEKAGFEIMFQQVNLRPGKPLIFARRGRQLAFGIPGNPVSHAVIFHLMLAPLFAAMTGRPGLLTLMPGQLEKDFPLRPNPRETYWPCRAAWREGGFRLLPLRFQSSGDVTGITGMNALLRIPAKHPSPMKQGDSMEFLWLDEK